jgi:hypothetical protein
LTRSISWAAQTRSGRDPPGFVYLVVNTVLMMRPWAERQTIVSGKAPPGACGAGDRDREDVALNIGGHGERREASGALAAGGIVQGDGRDAGRHDAMDDWPEGAQHAVLCDHRGTLAASACALVGAEGHLEHALVDAAGRTRAPRLSVAARVDAGVGETVRDPVAAYPAV